MAALHDLTISQRIALAAIYVAACFGLGLGIGALITRGRP